MKARRWAKPRLNHGKNRLEVLIGRAQETLHRWQLGLQTAFKNKAIPVPDEEYFNQTITDLAQRTYSEYLNIAANNNMETKSLSTTTGEVLQPTGSESVEYYIRSANGEETIDEIALGELKRKVGEGELDTVGLMVRVAGVPGKYRPYGEFLRDKKAQKAVA